MLNHFLNVALRMRGYKNARSKISGGCCCFGSAETDVQVHREGAQISLRRREADPDAPSRDRAEPPDISRLFRTTA